MVTPVGFHSPFDACTQVSIRNPAEQNEKLAVKHFFFDGAFGQDQVTEQIYADIAYPLVESVTEGYKICCFKDLLQVSRRGLV